MRKITLQLTAACVLAMSCSAGAQQVFYGLEEGLNRSTQLLYNPQRPADGTTQLNAASGFQLGAYATASGLFHNKVLDFFTYKSRLMYAKRGSAQPAQISELPLAPGSPNGIMPVIPVTQTNIKNSLHYLCLDVILQKDLFHFTKNASFFLEGGLGNNILLKSDIKPGELISASYPYDQYNNNQKLNRYNVSWIVGMGININDKFSLFAESNKAFTPMYRSSDLRVKDWSWSLSMAISIGHQKAL